MSEFDVLRVDPAAMVVDVDCDGDVFELVLCNIGGRVARDIVVTFSEPVHGVGCSDDVNKLPIWRNVRTMRPGKEIRVLLDSTRRLTDPDACNRFSVEVRWSSDTGAGRAVHHHDLTAYQGLPQRIDTDRLQGRPSAKPDRGDSS